MSQLSSCHNCLTITCHNCLKTIVLVVRGIASYSVVGASPLNLGQKRPKFLNFSEKCVKSGEKSEIQRGLWYFEQFLLVQPHNLFCEATPLQCLVPVPVVRSFTRAPPMIVPTPPSVLLVLAALILPCTSRVTPGLPSSIPCPLPVTCSVSVTCYCSSSQNT